MTVTVTSISAKNERVRLTKDQQIGIITGSGPEAGIDLWKKILSGRRRNLGKKYRGDIDAPNIKILSVSILGLSMDMERHGEEIWPDLLSAADEMANSCEVYSIACNTLHYFAPRLKNRHGRKFISVQQSLKEELVSQQKGSFALLGASPVVSLGKWSCFSQLAEEFQVETVIAPKLDEIIYNIKKTGICSEEISGEFEKIVNKIQNRIIVLGCTELPLIPRNHLTSHTFIDATALLARNLLDKSSI